MSKYPKEKVYNKLVRDKIPEIIEADGVKAELEIVSEEEAIKLLKEKLLEEGQELIEAKEIEDIKTEMSDILEIIHSLAEEMDISMKELEKTRVERAEKRGRFKKRIFLIRTTER